MSNQHDEASRLFRQPDVEKKNEYQREQEAIHMNRERLRAERLAREAASKINN